MRKSHLTAYKLSPASIATIYIPNTSSAVSASDILIVGLYLFKHLFGELVVCREVVFFDVLKSFYSLLFNYYSAKYKITWTNERTSDNAS